MINLVYLRYRMKHHILHIHPAEYLQQGSSHCGMYAVKGIVSAYGLDDGKRPEEYHLTLFGRVTGWAFPWTITRTLAHYGLASHVAMAPYQSDEKRLNMLKTLLDEGKPVILLIGNGYIANGSFSMLKAKRYSHWVTLWGYSDDEKSFYVYDSWVSKGNYDRMPIGNKKRSYADVLRDWGSVLILFGPWKYLYITVWKN